MKSDAAARQNETLVEDRNSTRSRMLGLWSALVAFNIWGVLPIYWKLLSFISPQLILLYRIFWSYVFLLAIVLKSGKLRQTFALLKHRRTAITVTVCSILLTGNWFIFIWAVNSGHIVETSLGYFLNPLINMILGVIFFRERPDPLQWLAILIAFSGVAVQVWIFGRLPWIALSLGTSFALYGMLRKTETIDSVPGLFLETSVMFPLVTAGLIWFWINGDTSLITSVPQTLLIMCAGIFTSIPLLLFAYSAQRLSLTTLGLTQYISPSISLLIGVFIYGEPLTSGHLISFMLIWIALAIYTFESIRLYRKATNLNWRE
ncbi:MAG: EamA family transporter RarD [Deltaproteobacteria bacterium]|jgi:chloramphenicol-sensitive protein RarD|nr:EamA family transporter RarD [Deltaproteobacteria bacterium]